MLWVYVVARMGYEAGDAGVWGKRERVEVRKLLGLDDGILELDLRGRSEDGSVEVKRGKRTTLTGPIVEEAFSGLGEDVPMSSKYVWCK